MSVGQLREDSFTFAFIFKNLNNIYKARSKRILNENRIPVDLLWVYRAYR